MMHTAEAGGFFAPDRDGFKAMMLLTSLRGTHSTGMAGIRLEKGEPAIVKSVGNPYRLFGTNGVDKFVGNILMKYKTVIGHCRFATRGTIDAMNAHPFREGHIILAHNGVISNFHALKDYKEHKHIDVDSHLVAKLFQEKGAEKVLPTLDGAFVFTWLDLNTRTFNVAKNSERPLYAAKIKGKNTLFFASEEATLAWHSQRNKVEFDEFWEVPDNIIYTYPMDSITPVETPFESYKRPPVKYHRGYRELDDWEDYAAPVKRSYQSVDHTVEGGKLLSIINGDASLKRGDTIKLDILSWMEQTTSDFVFVNCGLDGLPHVKFTCTVPKAKFQADGGKEAVTITGKILTMALLEPETRGKRFTSYLEYKEFGFDIDDDDKDEWIDVPNIAGTTEAITKYRLAEIAKDGCGWCQCHLTPRDLSDPSKLFLYDDEERKTQVLVCPACVADCNIVKED